MRKLYFVEVGEQLNFLMSQKKAGFPFYNQVDNISFWFSINMKPSQIKFGRVPCLKFVENQKMNIINLIMGTPENCQIREGLLNTH